MALEGKFKESSAIDEPNRRLTKLAIFALFCGITFVAVFGLINIVHKVDRNERTCKMRLSREKPDQCRPKKDIEKLSIPYGSIEPPKAEQDTDESDEAQSDSGESGKPTKTKL